MTALGQGVGVGGGGSGKGWQGAALCELPRSISQHSRDLHTHWFPHQLLSSWNQEKEEEKAQGSYLAFVPSSARVPELLSRITARPCHPLVHTSLWELYSCLVSQARELWLQEGRGGELLRATQPMTGT